MAAVLSQECWESHVDSNDHCHCKLLYIDCIFLSIPDDNDNDNDDCDGDCDDDDNDDTDLVKSVVDFNWL